MLQSTVFVLPIGGLWALGKKFHGRTWENLCGSSCVGTLTCWKVLVTVERGSIAEDLLRLTGCSTSLSTGHYYPVMENSKLWLALAGSCKLRGCVPAHLITCSSAQPLPAPCSQHLVEEKGNIPMSCGSKSCLWGSSES